MWTPCYFAGMIVPYVVAYSLMFGAVISSGIMWPLIAQHEGQWYQSGLQSQDFRGLFGYKVRPQLSTSPAVCQLSHALQVCLRARAQLLTTSPSALRSSARRVLHAQYCHEKQQEHTCWMPHGVCTATATMAQVTSRSRPAWGDPSSCDSQQEFLLVSACCCCGASIEQCVLLQNFIAIAIFIGDGLYNFLKIGILSLQVWDVGLAVAMTWPASGSCN